jgi:HK97 family phage portal protein
MTPAVFKAQIMLHLLVRGNFYALKNVVNGQIRSLIPLVPDNMQVELNSFLEPTYTWTDPKTGKRSVFAQDKILHVQGLVYDGAVGIGLRDVAARLINLDLSMADHARAFFDNQAVPGQMVLKHPGNLKAEDQKKLKEDIEANYSRANKFRTMLLTGGMDVTSLAQTANDSQLTQQQQNVAMQICSVMGVPPHKIGLMDKMTYNNIEHRGIDFVRDGLMPYLVRIEEAITASILGEDSPYYCKFNEKALLRGDSKTQADINHLKLQDGALSPNEWRAYDGQEPYEGGDIFMRQLNMGTAPTGETPQGAPPVQTPRDEGE